MEIMLSGTRRLLKSKNMGKIRIDSDMIDVYCSHAQL